MANIISKSSDAENGQASEVPEVEFALVLQRIISAVSDDPVQLRNNIYELARMKLRKEMFGVDAGEALKLTQALETAIKEVEIFSQRSPALRLDLGKSSGLPDYAALPPTHVPSLRVSRTLVEAPSLIESPALPRAVAVPPPVEARPENVPVNSRFIIGMVVVLMILTTAGLQRLGFWDGLRSRIVSWQFHLRQALPSSVVPPIPHKPVLSDVAPSAPTLREVRTPSFGWPMPSTYGSYAVVNGQLAELELLPAAAPDRRVAISAIIGTPSQNFLPDGSPTFIVFRRDLANVPLEEIDIRSVAKIRPASKSAKKQPDTPDGSWSIRNISHRFKASPLPGSSEMLLIRPESALPAGRYVLVLKRQAYDFSVSGEITDINQCLELFEAANGTFYSPCNRR